MKLFAFASAGLLLAFGSLEARTIGINVALRSAPTNAVLQDLGKHGRVLKTFTEVNALTMRVDSTALRTIQTKPYVLSANTDAERKGSPVDTVALTNFAGGLSTWNLDAVNVTNFGAGRVIPETGRGVYVAVLDTGLHDSWRQYFPQERIAANLAKAFRGGGGDNGNVSEPPNMWEHDQDGHGTHVTSTILGFSLSGTPINGVAPQATVIPVKVLGQNGSGWSSVIAEGIVYIANLKKGVLARSPVVINMSLGGSQLDAVEQAAIDYAIAQGVIIVAAAGNEGMAGMSYPGAYAPVISVAASGWTGEWTTAANNWWYSKDVPEPTRTEDFYIAEFSSRARAGQDLDVAAPGSWVVGPTQTNSGQLSYFFLGGTSMASPHVAGIVALMAQRDPGLSPFRAEMLLEESAIPMTAGCRNIIDPNVGPTQICWGSDATGRGLVTADAALAKLGQ